MGFLLVNITYVLVWKVVDLEAYEKYQEEKKLHDLFGTMSNDEYIQLWREHQAKYPDVDVYKLTSVKSTSDNALKDILPIQPASNGDIPVFVELLRKAQESKDISLCDSLPEPQEQLFDFDDYVLPPPNRIAWINYCQALVTEDPSLCLTKTHGHPNLSQECHYVLEKILMQKNNSYAFCYEQFGSLYTSSDEVRNCLLKFDLTNAPEFYQKLEACMKLSDDPVYSEGPERDICLYDLALESGKEKVCDIIQNPYSSHTYSVPNCLDELK